MNSTRHAYGSSARSPRGPVDIHAERPYTFAMFERTLSNDVASLVTATEELEQFLARAAVGAEASYACTLALEEVVTNVFKYAYDDAGAHAVRFTAQLTSDHVVLRFSDDGRPFDPLAAPPPDLARPLEERAIGGLGIHLVRKLADALVYERSGDRNLLTARFALRPKAPVN
jgi:serine/threonine-protein kinase RsbW